jgi:predicted regulator of Ras-like GTPase activity (Roadblock/LC7/MglB family)
MPAKPKVAFDTSIFKKTAPVAQPAPVQPMMRAPEEAPSVISIPTAPVGRHVPIQPAPEPEPEAHAVISMPSESAAPVASSGSPITPIAPEPEAERAPIRFNPPQPTAPTAPNFKTSIAGETRFLTLPIAEVAGAWPGPVQQEIMTHQLTTSAIALPFGVVEQAIKQGKVALPWKILRSWIKPPVRIASSPNDAMMLELPLKILTPLFLTELKAAKPQKKIEMDENIPDLFSNRMESASAFPPVPGAMVPQPETESSPVMSLHSAASKNGVSPSGATTVATKAADTNYFAKLEAEQAEEVAPPVKKGGSPGTAFLQRYATPNEIVGKAAVLPGVEGALIALPDGLLVASRIPPTMNGETIAGFLSQIFNRVSQCTKELRMGDLNNLNFTIGSVPWKIFKVGAIYFAAFGRPGEPLPTSQLAGIAAELDRKAK